ncbi:MAG: YfjI family protein [Pseudoprimorskyibacter sp.]|nr:YfjI family protein [Pseudoprimorskyibacter sp.]
MSEYKNYDWDNPENPNALASNDMGLEGLNWDDIDENGYHEPLSDQKSNQPQASISPFSTPQTDIAPQAATASPTLSGFAKQGIKLPKPDAPEQVYRKPPTSHPFPVYALGPLLQPVVEAVTREVEAPIAIAASSALSIASLSVQGFANVELLHGCSPVSLYCLTVALSGERKSAVDNLLAKPLKKHERQQQTNYNEELKAFKRARIAYEQMELTVKKSIRSGNSGEEDLESLGDYPNAPLHPDRIVTEPTFEGLTKLFHQGNPSLGLLSDEGGQFLGGHAMNRDNHQKTLTALSKLWDGAAIKRTRAGDGSITLNDKRLALHLMVQPIIAENFLCDSLAVGQGFVPRMLICHPKSTIGHRSIAQGPRKPEVSEQDAMALDNWNQRIGQILSIEMPSWDGDKTGKQGRNLKIDLDSSELLSLSGDARTLLAEFAQRIELAQVKGGVLAELTGTASKIAEQACRIAGVMTLVSNISARMIDRITMQNAITLAEWYLTEALRLTNAAAISQHEKEVANLREWLYEKWPEIAQRDDFNAAFILPQYIVKNGPNTLRTTAKAKKALAELQTLGVVRKAEAGTEVNGIIPKLAYHVIRC